MSDREDPGAAVPALALRRYDPRDADAVWRLHELALRDAGTDPADVPGTDDLRSVETSYLDGDGGFVVGTVPPDAAGSDAPRVHDGALVAMGGFLPSTDGHDDERTVAGAAELHRMRVAPSCQRRGYGRELLAALETAVRAAGHDLVLATTAARQRAAVRFYPVHGYEKTGESTVAGYELYHFQKRLG